MADRFTMTHYTASLSSTRQAPFSAYQPMPLSIKGSRKITAPSSGRVALAEEFIPAPPPGPVANGPYEELVYSLGAVHYFALDGSNDGNDKLGGLTINPATGGSITIGAGDANSTVPAEACFQGATYFSGTTGREHNLEYSDGLSLTGADLAADAAGYTICALTNLEGSSFSPDGAWLWGGNEDNYSIGFDGGSTVGVHIREPGGVRDSASSSGRTGSDDDEWVFTAARYETGTMQINGKLKDQTLTIISNGEPFFGNLGAHSAPTGSFYIGQGRAGFAAVEPSFSGLICGIAVFDEALSWEDIDSLMSASFNL